MKPVIILQYQTVVCQTAVTCIYMYTRVYIYNICNFVTIFNEIKADHSAHSPEMTNKVKY